MDAEKTWASRALFPEIGAGIKFPDGRYKGSRDMARGAAGTEELEV